MPNCKKCSDTPHHPCIECIKEQMMVINKEAEDMINKPSHYTQWWIEPLDFIISNDMSFPQWNVIKYVTRYKYKNWLEDLKKAKVYLNKLIESYEVHDNISTKGGESK